MSASHVVDDIYQGCVPALLPFLVAERHYTYALSLIHISETTRPY